MCLAVPAQLIAVNDAIGTVELTGATRDCSLLLVPEAKVGDWLLVHAGFAVQIVDEEEAQKGGVWHTYSVDFSRRSSSTIAKWH